MMWLQTVPLIFLIVLFAISLVHSSKTSRLSILVLGVIAINFFCAVLLHLHPRSGHPFASLSAMLFFGVAYGMLSIPLLFIKRGREDVGIDAPCELSVRTYLTLSVVLIVLTLPVSIYDFYLGIRGLFSYATSGMSREAYRRTHLITESGGITEFCFFLESFSYCALFLSAVGVVHFPKFKKLGVLLLIGGLAPTFWSYSTIARSGAFKSALFYLMSVLIMALPRLRKRRNIARVFLSPAIVVLLISSVIPFSVLTVIRFTSVFAPNEYKKTVQVAVEANTAEQEPKTVIVRGSNKEGLLYSSFSYFCTGAYSFNADYVVRYEKGLPSFSGVLTMGPVMKFVDLLSGGKRTKTATTLFEKLHSAAPDEWPRSLYSEVSGAYSGEFKTMIGYLCLDYPPWGVMLFCFVVALGAGLAFAFMRSGTLAYNLLQTIYCYTLVYGLMLWPWRSVRQGLILFWLLGFVLLLWFLSSRNRKYGE